MNSDPYQPVAFEGLAPLVESIGRGPEWHEIEARSIIVAQPLSKPASRWILAIAAVMLLALPGLLVVFGGTAMPEQSYEGPPGGGVVYLSNDSHLVKVDIAAAELETFRLPLAPGDPPYRLVRREKSLVFYGLSPDSGPAAYALDVDRLSDPQQIAASSFFIPSASPNLIWLASIDESSPPQVRALESVSEVTIEGQVVRGPLRTPSGIWPIAHLRAGFVFHSSLGDGRLEVWDPDQQKIVESLSGTHSVATFDNRIVTWSEEGSLHLIDLDRDSDVAVALPDGIEAIEPGRGAFSPDGRFVAVPGFDRATFTRPDITTSLVLIDFERAISRAVPDTSSGPSPYRSPLLAWSGDGELVYFLVNGEGSLPGELTVYTLSEDATYIVPVRLEGSYFGVAGS